MDININIDQFVSDYNIHKNEMQLAADIIAEIKRHKPDISKDTEIEIGGQHIPLSDLYSAIVCAAHLVRLRKGE